MNDLIERIEAASGPDRKLDAEIFRAIGSPLPTQFGPLGIALEWDDDGISATVPVRDLQVRFTPPAFTASIDAARTLVPEGWVRSLFDADNGDGLARLEHEERDVEVHARGKTWPLAICAAALKARAYLKETNNAD